MTAPSPTARGTPSGLQLENSHPVFVTLGKDPTIGFWEKELQPPGYEGGDPIDRTTQFNTKFRTKAPRYLIDVTNMKGKAAFDPLVYVNVKSAINRKDTITKTFADGSTICFYGYLKSFIPANEPGDGTQPEADFEIVPTNVDPVTGAEESPVETNVAGT